MFSLGGSIGSNTCFCQRNTSIKTNIKVVNIKGTWANFQPEVQKSKKKSNLKKLPTEKKNSYILGRMLTKRKISYTSLYSVMMTAD